MNLNKLQATLENDNLAFEDVYKYLKASPNMYQGLDDSYREEYRQKYNDLKRRAARNEKVGIYFKVQLVQALKYKEVVPSYIMGLMCMDALTIFNWSLGYNLKHIKQEEMV